MPRKVTIDTGRALQQFGVVGAARQFELGDGPLVPTIQVADISRSMAGDFIEPRGIVGGALVAPAPGGGSPVVELICASEGGLIVEDVQLSAGNLGGSFFFTDPVEGAWVVDIRGAAFEPRTLPQHKGTRIPLINSSALLTLDVGSILTRSFANRGARDDFSMINFGIDDDSAWLPPEFRFAPGARWFVPPGGQLFIMMNSVSGPNGDPTATASLTFRELIGRGSPDAGRN